VHRRGGKIVEEATKKERLGVREKDRKGKGQGKDRGNVRKSHSIVTPMCSSAHYPPFTSCLPPHAARALTVRTVL